MSHKFYRSVSAFFGVLSGLCITLQAYAIPSSLNEKEMHLLVRDEFELLVQILEESQTTYYVQILESGDSVFTVIRDESTPEELIEKLELLAIRGSICEC